MKKFLEAVVVGGVALILGAFLGLFIDGVLDQYDPESDSIMELVIEYFLPLWFIALLVGIVALILAVADVV